MSGSHIIRVEGRVQLFDSAGRLTAGYEDRVAISLGWSRIGINCLDESGLYHDGGFAGPHISFDPTSSWRLVQWLQAAFVAPDTRPTHLSVAGHSSLYAGIALRDYSPHTQAFADGAVTGNWSPSGLELSLDAVLADPVYRFADGKLARRLEARATLERGAWPPDGFRAEDWT